MTAWWIRRKLSTIVFADRGAPRAVLNAIMYIQTGARRAGPRAGRDRNGGSRTPLRRGSGEPALLIEAGFDKKLDCLLVTWCTPEQPT